MSERVLVVGATSALGEAVASEFHADGWQVAAMGRNGERVGALADRHGYQPLVADVTDYEGLAAAARELDLVAGEEGLGAVINCVGDSTAGSLHDISPADIQRMVLVNTMGPMLVARAFEPLVARGGGGRIVTVTSAAPSFGPSDTNSVYLASKAGAANFIASHAKAGRRGGVSMTDFAPGALERDMANTTGERRQQAGGLGYQDAASLILSICKLGPHIDVPVLGAHSLNRWRR
jgi:NAD(P)-dependent dehydrogenase (short-subunit alcohol dehydrogenase family)